jgi:hypothetical protein
MAAQSRAWSERGRSGDHRRSRSWTHPPESSADADRDPGLLLLLGFIVAILVMVGAVAVVAVASRWWVLLAAMLVDVAATFSILAALTRLLRDEDE